MFKKLVTSVMVLAIVFTAAACSKKEETTEMDKQVAYNSAKIAEDKVNTLFHKATTADETAPILDPATGTPEKAKELLVGYLDAALVDKIMAHYITDKKDGDNVIVNSEPFFAASLMGTTFADASVDGDKEEFTVTTKDNGVYTVKWLEDGEKYIVTNYEKK